MQPPARETLAPAYGPAPDGPTTGTPASGSTKAAGRARRDRRQHEAAPPRHHTKEQHAATDRSAPAPHPRTAHPTPTYDARAVCSWAQGTGLGSSIVQACREQLSGH
ncbi:hypothetical protein N4G70_12600 [Streptomyces sp. ASQP_92]|uniref:hypothetical protein n=1 Tax=Streptomyces sp. ASQP_92 TaxID=2979116 RepID=UPI0021C0EFE4|nr:hypothetical protein [Streptomyces sp. ASQP_92]MCT9089707.1 hypothetical protein [Streptomyces sp. ASQP_92]